MSELSKLMKWTHENVKITDIRKSNKLYVLSLDIDEIKTPLFVNDLIFEERLRSYFLNDDWTRQDVLELYWNFLINKGFYLKIDKNGINKIDASPEKYYISFLEIAGSLGTIQSVYNGK